MPPIVVHPYAQEGGWRLGFLPTGPADVPVRTEPMKFSSAVAESRDFCAENSLLIVNVLKKVLTHQVSVKQLSGPVGIAVAAGQAVKERYWLAKFDLAAGISLNLGILNLLPFPILDGGLDSAAADREHHAPRHQHDCEGAHLPGRVCGAGGVLRLHHVQRLQQAADLLAPQAVKQWSVHSCQFEVQNPGLLN